MRFLRYLPLAALVFAGACDEDGTVTNVTRPPLAYIRYVHAVPNAGPLDFKFIDAVEYSPSYANSTFRTIGIFQGARAGSRRIKVFLNSSNIDSTKVTLVDTTLTLTANTYYTIAHMGFRNPGAGQLGQRLVLIEETRPAQNTGIHWRSVNLMVGEPNQDVHVGAAPGTTAATNVAPGVGMAYLARATGTFTVHTTDAGVATSRASATPFAGVAGNTTADPVGGFNIAGSQMSAFHFPRSVAGSAAPQTAAFTAPAIAIVIDKQPPRTVPDA